MKTYERIVIYGAGIWFFAACSPAPAPPAEDRDLPPMPAVQFPTDPVTQWLECEECDQGERAAVVQMGGDAVPGLISALSGGAPTERLNTLDQALRGSYARLQAGAGDTQLESEADYIARYRANFVARYQVRAAMALGDIGGAGAAQALSAVDTASAREDVQAAVRDGLRRIRGG